MRKCNNNNSSKTERKMKISVAEKEREVEREREKRLDRCTFIIQCVSTEFHAFVKFEAAQRILR